MTQECAEYRALYEKMVLPPSVGPRVDWARVLEQKQNQVREGQYGPGMAELEQQIAEHNILQNGDKGTQIHIFCLEQDRDLSLEGCPEP